MTQPSTLSTSHQTFKKVNNHNDYRSKIRDTTRKFDLSPSPSSSHHSSVAIKPNNTRTNETFTPSISSSSDSITSEYVVNPSPKQYKRSLSIPNSKHISTANIEIRSPVQQKTISHHKRTPPPPPKSPRFQRTFEHDEDHIYVNSDNEFENEEKNFPEINDEDEIEDIESFPTYAKPNLNHREIQSPPSILTNQTRSNTYRSDDEKSSHIQNRFKNSDIDSIGLEIIEPIPLSSRRLPPPPPIPPPPPTFAKSFLQNNNLIYTPQRSLPLSNFLMELGALLVVFIVCMVLVLAIKEDEIKLRTTTQLVYTYIYAVSIIWMIWCTFDITKFRRQWMNLTADAHDHEEYMDITERHPHIMFYFPDIHNTGGLFMRIGAGLLCMGSLILTVIELGKTVVRIGSEESTRSIPTTTYSSSVIITRIISYIFRFIFHCVQFSFLFRYGNLVINRYHLVAKIGLIHLIIANFCTWFEAIVYETLEQLHKSSDTYSTTTTVPRNVTYSTATGILTQGVTITSDSKTDENQTALAILIDIESTMGVYLYPCLIEYSLISLTVFFIMWRNIGQIKKRSFLRFGDRHVFTINCARSSRGLLIGGILFLLTILTLIPSYLLDDDAASVAHITGLVLLIVSFFTVCLSYFHTTKLYYDRHAHVDVFDQVLIQITTVGDFAYSFFGLFASIFVCETRSKLPVGIEISIGFVAIFQTFLQSGFIIDTLKRRTTTKQENRNKPGRETITALLLMNLAIWLHDSLSAKKVRLNPSKVAYYDGSTWAIIQAFTSPLSIFYRFHSSVCLADIWQEVYHDNDGTRLGGKQRMHRLMTISSTHENQH